MTVALSWVSFVVFTTALSFACVRIYSGRLNAKLPLKKAGHDAPEKYFSNLLKVNLYGFN